jgi:hypothetical protein
MHRESERLKGDDDGKIFIDQRSVISPGFTVDRSEANKTKGGRDEKDDS